jgi:putative Mg2+ transporter-C (MgtC) family protein
MAGEIESKPSWGPGKIIAVFSLVLAVAAAIALAIVFLGHPAMTTSWKIVIRILVSLAFGGLVGIERELTDHPAGIRTHILVTVGACAFTTMSLYGFFGFPGGDRVAAAVVTGIGFIGGGAILKAKDGWVTGLTTAASLWSCAAIGMLVGTGFYVVGLVVTGMDLVVLELIDWIVDRIAPRYKTRKLPVRVTGHHAAENLARIMNIFTSSGCGPDLIRYNRLDNGDSFDMSVVAKISTDTDVQGITDNLYGIQGVSDVLWG